MKICPKINIDMKNVMNHYCNMYLILFNRPKQLKQN